MLQKLRAIGGSCLFGWMLLSGPWIGSAWAEDLHVPAEHRSIQAALDVAQSGDRVLVSAAKIRERVVCTVDDVTIEGQDTTWRRRGRRPVLQIDADDVTVRGFRFERTGAVAIGDRLTFEDLTFDRPKRLAALAVAGDDVFIQSITIADAKLRPRELAVVDVTGRSATILELDVRGVRRRLRRNVPRPAALRLRGELALIEDSTFGEISGGVGVDLEGRDSLVHSSTFLGANVAFRAGGTRVTFAANDLVMAGGVQFTSAIELNGSAHVVRRVRVDRPDDWLSSMPFLAAECDDLIFEDCTLPGLLSIVGDGAQLDAFGGRVEIQGDRPQISNGSGSLLIEGHDSTVAGSTLGPATVHGDRGRIEDNRFVDGSLSVHGHDNVLSENRASGSFGGLIFVQGDRNQLLASNASSGFLVQGNGNRVEECVVGGGHTGIRIEGDDNAILDSRVTAGSGDAGFRVDGRRNRLENNIADACRRDGFWIAGGGNNDLIDCSADACHNVGLRNAAELTRVTRGSFLGNYRDDIVSESQFARFEDVVSERLSLSAPLPQ